jgi:putative FmdB family regulatory protein
MPIYEYICEDCKHHFESIRSMKEADSPISCANCSSQHTTRQLSTFFSQSDGNNNFVGSNNRGCASCYSKKCSTCG